MFPSKTTVIIVDRATQHDSEEVRSFVEEMNGDEDFKPGHIVLAFVREHLTSIIQVGDVMFNRPIKHAIRKKYWELRHSRVEGMEKFRITRGQMVTIIEDVIAEFNMAARRDLRVRKGFEKCGMNPYVPSKIEFTKHIESLSLESLYRTKLAAKKPLYLR
jgi:hypothetical protein